MPSSTAPSSTTTPETKSVSAPTPATVNLSTSSAKSSQIEDLAESQSAPVGHATTAFQQQQYRHFLQHGRVSGANHQASVTPRTAMASDLSTTATQPLPLHQQVTATGGVPVDVPLKQQQMALMRAKPGQFTLVSNQQVGPGHVTMIGYTTPIVKVGGIVKIDQISPGQMPRHSEASPVAPSPISGQTQAASASSAIYHTSGAASAMYNSPVHGGISHHSQMINHNVAQPKVHEVAHDLRVGTHASLMQEAPRAAPQQPQAAALRSNSDAALSASLSASPADPTGLYFEKQSMLTQSQLPPTYGYASSPESNRAISAALRKYPSYCLPIFLFLLSIPFLLLCFYCPLLVMFYGLAACVFIVAPLITLIFVVVPLLI